MKNESGSAGQMLSSTERLPRVPALADPERCSLYFLAGAGLIKIGISSNITSRIRAIRNSSPIPLELLATVKGVTLLNEMRLHGKFRHLRRHSEWFEDEGSIRAYLDALPSRDFRPLSLGGVR